MLSCTIPNALIGNYSDDNVLSRCHSCDIVNLDQGRQDKLERLPQNDSHTGYLQYLIRNTGLRMEAHKKPRSPSIPYSRLRRSQARAANVQRTTRPMPHLFSPLL